MTGKVLVKDGLAENDVTWLLPDMNQGLHLHIGFWCGFNLAVILDLVGHWIVYFIRHKLLSLRRFS